MNNMSKQEQIITLFKGNFQAKDYLKRAEPCKFTCENQSECEVDVVNDPIWMPVLGDEDTKIMIVAEAPSFHKKYGVGPHVGGRIDDWIKENDKDAGPLLSFVGKCFHTAPYFTDLMKCGLQKQSNSIKNAKFPMRTKNCVVKYLIEEIRIIKPEVILCVGKRAYDELIKYKDQYNYKIIKLLHYGKQANLQLTSADKENIIWPLQCNKISKDKAIKSLLQLNSIKKLLS
jgi:uracil-DNA glycosylase